MQAAVPPEEVRDAFDEVNRADQVEQQLIQESEAYEQQVVLEAEGQAARILAEANGYKDAVIALASGESERFSKIVSEYSKAPEITRKRLYLETMEEVLGGANKVVVDQKEGGNNIMYLPLDQLMKNANTPRNTIEVTPSSSRNIPNISINSSSSSSNIREGR